MKIIDVEKEGKSEIEPGEESQDEIEIIEVSQESSLDMQNEEPVKIVNVEDVEIIEIVDEADQEDDWDALVASDDEDIEVIGTAEENVAEENKKHTIWTVIWVVMKYMFLGSLYLLFCAIYLAWQAIKLLFWCFIFIIMLFSG